MGCPPPANLGGKPISCDNCVRIGEKKFSAVLPRTRKSMSSHRMHAICKGHKMLMGIRMAGIETDSLDMSGDTEGFSDVWMDHLIQDDWELSSRPHIAEVQFHI